MGVKRRMRTGSPSTKPSKHLSALLALSSGGAQEIWIYSNQTAFLSRDKRQELRSVSYRISSARVKEILPHNSNSTFSWDYPLILPPQTSSPTSLLRSNSDPMNMSDHSSFSLQAISTTRPKQLRLIDKQEIIEHIQPPQLNIPSKMIKLARNLTEIQESNWKQLGIKTNGSSR